MIIAPSILSLEPEKYLQGIKMINRSLAEWIHLDVMDGLFVPNKTFDHKMVRRIRQLTTKILDVHLMVDEPLPLIKNYELAGADIVTIHYESLKNGFPDFTKWHSEYPYLKLGISIKPQTNPDKLIPVLGWVDLVLIMSVEPGWGGQRFIPETLEKISWLVEYREKNNLKFLISVDGGVNSEVFDDLKEADTLVIGSYLFKEGRLSENIEKIKEIYE